MDTFKIETHKRLNAWNKTKRDYYLKYIDPIWKITNTETYLDITCDVLQQAIVNPITRVNEIEFDIRQLGYLTQYMINYASSHFIEELKKPFFYTYKRHKEYTLQNKEKITSLDEDIKIVNKSGKCILTGSVKNTLKDRMWEVKGIYPEMIHHYKCIKQNPKFVLLILDDFNLSESTDIRISKTLKEIKHKFVISKQTEMRSYGWGNIYDYEDFLKKL